jgi:Protein of unknown function (DUF3575)
LGFAEFDNNLNISAEYQLNKRWAVQLETGFVFGWNTLPNSDMDTYTLTNIRGIKLKPSIRYYGKCKHANTTRFIALEPFFKQVNADFSATHVGGNYAYPLHKRVLGSSIIMGKSKQFYNNIYIEYFIGLGVRNLNYHYGSFVSKSTPAFFNPSFIDEFNSGPIAPNFNLGFKICYRF